MSREFDGGWRIWVHPIVFERILSTGRQRESRAQVNETIYGLPDVPWIFLNTLIWATRMNRYQFQVVTYYILHRQKQYRRACIDTRFLRYSLRSELVHTFVYLHSNALAHSYFERRKCLIIIHGIIKVLANSRGVCVISCHCLFISLVSDRTVVHSGTLAVWRRAVLLWFWDEIFQVLHKKVVLELTNVRFEFQKWFAQSIPSLGVQVNDSLSEDVLRFSCKIRSIQLKWVYVSIRNSIAPWVSFEPLPCRGECGALASPQARRYLALSPTSVR